MQKDMHFYGTYAMAKAAGIPQQDAYTIAYAAQYVDDSTKQDSAPHSDGGLLYGIATAHSGLDCILNHHSGKFERMENQRRVWVPFHFLPGAKGENLKEKLLCAQDSPVAQDMIANHLEQADKKRYGLELLGIAAHVYMDTFSHYGFSGIGCELNAIEGKPIALEVQNEEMENYVLSKFGRFMKKLKLATIASQAIEDFTGSLGHGSVATFPDRPYLKWKLTYEKPRSTSEQTTVRTNQETFMTACERLYTHFREFAEVKGYNEPSIPFEDLRPAIKNILAYEGACEARITQWKNLEWQGQPLIEPETYYSEREWENQKFDFDDAPTSTEAIDSNVYRFHQAAAYHRYYVLKDLLPAHGIAIY